MRERIKNTNFWYQHFPRKGEWRVYWSRGTKKCCLMFNSYSDMSWFFRGVVWASIMSSAVAEKVKMESL